MSLIEKGRVRTAFEVFLQNSNEKRKSSVVLGRLLRQALIRPNMSILDVGAGGGELIVAALRLYRPPRGTHLTLVEPDKRHVQRLEELRSCWPPCLRVEIVSGRIENVLPVRKFDVVLASHLPFPKSALGGLYERLITVVIPGGQMIIVLRETDDVHDFRSRYKTRIMRSVYVSLTIDDAVEVLNSDRRFGTLAIQRFRAAGTLRIPSPGASSVGRIIVEFLLNAAWQEIPPDVRRDIAAYLRRRRGILKLIDGFAVVQVPIHSG